MKRPVFVTSGRIAKETGLSVSTVIRAVQKGLLEHFTTPGGHFRVNLEDAKRLLQPRRQIVARTKRKKGARHV